jgi:hypothetical protein
LVAARERDIEEHQAFLDDEEREEAAVRQSHQCQGNRRWIVGHAWACLPKMGHWAAISSGGCGLLCAARTVAKFARLKNL